MAEKKEELKKTEKPRVSAKQQAQKAKLAAKKAKKGKHIIRKYKIRSKVTFRKPKTQMKSVKPIVLKKSSPSSITTMTMPSSNTP